MIKQDNIVGFDFETLPITDSEPYPKPVGVSLEYPRGNGFYIDFTNKSGVRDFKEFCKQTIFNSKFSILGHNTIYDLMVADTHFEWFDKKEVRWDCTQILSWLVNPELTPQQMGLKSLSSSWLGDPPEDQKELHDWLYENQESFIGKYKHCTKNGKPLVAVDEEGNPKKKNKSYSKWGTFICEGPIELVSKYAISDVRKTFDLYDYILKNTFLSDLKNRNSLELAYIREKRVQEVLAERTRKGIRLDVSEMRKDIDIISSQIEIMKNDILTDLEIDSVSSPKQLTNALVNKGYVKSFKDYVDYSDGNGLPSTAIDSLEKATDHIIIQDIKLLKRLEKFKSTYIKGWLDRSYKGRMHFSFFTMLNTGRISASTLGNIPNKSAEKVIKCSPKYKDFLPPKLRKYILPDEDCVLITGDYAAQELRMLAHYCGGLLAEWIKNDPRADIHLRTVEEFKTKFNVDITRVDAKAINFGIIYGQGDYALSHDLGVDVETAVRMKECYLMLFDGIDPFERRVKSQLLRGLPVHTIARRKFYKRVALYIYINRLIQGSSSDQLKAFMVKYDEHPDRKGELYFPLHDEGVFNVPKKHVESEIIVIKECMENCGIPLDVPFVVDLEVKKKNYLV